MTESETNAPDPDHELDELAFLQKKAKSLISYALKKGWITEAEASALSGDVDAATLDNIWSVSQYTADAIYAARKEYDRNYGLGQ